MDNSTAASNVSGKNAKLNQKAWKYIQDINSTSAAALNKVALNDGVKAYTYGLMFRMWERYASVFTALRMTKEQDARVGLMGSTASETIFAFYGLNMVGAEISLFPSYNAFRLERLKTTIIEERLTDLIITDDFAQPAFIYELLQQMTSLSLRNIIILHVQMGGPTVHSIITAAHETKYMSLQSMFAPICMDNLLIAYGDTPVSLSDYDSCDTSFILHTSGTTSGTGKPIVLSDKAFNAVCNSIYKMEGYNFLKEDLVCGLMVDLSNAYGIINQVHLPFAFGGTVITVPGNALNPTFYRAVPEYKFTLLFSITAMIDHWTKLPENTRFDFSSLKAVVIGGSAVPAKDKKRFLEFFKKHGSGDIPIIVGYGISELGGVCCLSKEDIEDESIGYLLPGLDVRLYDEEKEKFLSLKDAPCSGVLFMSSPAMATPVFDEKEILKTEVIGRKSFVTTNDLVQVDKDGKLTFLGRANRYFINDDGRKYESGRVETEIGRQAGIESCGIIPYYVKTRHDNIPVLCVKTLPGTEPKETVKNALLQVFKVEKTLEQDQIPSRVMFVEEFPRNGNGKIDLFKISKGEVTGESFTIKPVKRLGQLNDFKFTPVGDETADMIKEVFSDIASDVKNNLPFNKKKEEDSNMTQNNCFNPFGAFNAANQMGSQMMNMMGQNMMPNMMNMMQSMMPNMGCMQNFMQNMGQFAPNANAMPGMPNFMQGFTNMLTPINSYMTQLNMQHWAMLQQMFDQNTKMMIQVNQMVQQYNPFQGFPNANPQAQPAPTEGPAAEESK
jgi:acyl-coenzyme A synthetase/AMP-(fatty) acid ligase